MPQPQGSNETRLPRAVLRQSAALQARLDGRNKPPESEQLNPTQVASEGEGGEPSKTELAARATSDLEVANIYSPEDPRKGEDAAYWKARFGSTSGLLARERTESRQRMNALQTQVSELQGQIETLKLSTPTAAAKPDIATFFTPEQIAKYGDEQCEVMATTAMRAASETAKKLVDAAVQPLKEQRETTQRNEVETAKQAFNDELTRLYPNWPTDDVDPSWIAWLEEIDDMTEEPRGKILDSHVRRGNAGGAARMFKAWKASKKPAPAPAAAAPPPPPPAPPMTPSSRAGAPGPGDGGTQVANSEAAAKGVPSAVEIKDFYKRQAIKKPGQQGYVTDKERTEFEARLRLRYAPA